MKIFNFWKDKEKQDNRYGNDILRQSNWAMPLGQVTFEPKEAYKELCKGLWGKQSRHRRCRGPGAGLTVAVEWCRSTEEESVLEQCARGRGHGRCLELTSLRLSSSSHITTADKEESPARGFLTILGFFQYHFLESTVLKLMLIFYLFHPHSLIYGPNPTIKCSKRWVFFLLLPQEAFREMRWLWGGNIGLKSETF